MNFSFVHFLLPIRYFTKQLPVCPLCGQRPRWRMSRFNGVGTERRFAARCSNCKGSFSFQSGDVAGKESDNFGWFLLMNIFLRRPLQEPYVMIENLGLLNSNDLQRRSEYLLGELRVLSGKFTTSH